MNKNLLLRIGRHLLTLTGGALLLLSGGPTGHAASPFAVRGVVEGYYGTPWTFEDRVEVIDFMRRHNMNTFVYAPKLDPYQRESWREPYPSDQLDELVSTARFALRVGVDFGYSISPGWGMGDNTSATSICYSCPDDLELLLEKFSPFLDTGVRTFMLSFDDVWSVLVQPEDQYAYDSVAEAQCDLANRLETALIEVRPNARLFFTPTDYCGTKPSDYLETLRTHLSPSIDVLWTGSTVYSPEIPLEDALAYGELIGRPPLVWDNYPVNDMTTSNSLHLGPLYGRAPDLYEGVRGLLANPMLQPLTGRIPLATIADYLEDPASYDPQASLEAALIDVGESGSWDLRLFALQCQSSAMNREDAVVLRDALETLTTVFDGPWWLDAAAAVDQELSQEAVAGQHLPDSLPDPRMGEEIDRWLARFRLNLEAADVALETLRYQKPGLHDLEARDVGAQIQVSGIIDLAVPLEARAGLERMRLYQHQLGDDPTHVHGQRFQYYPNFGHMDIYAGDNVVWNFLNDTEARTRRWLRFGQAGGGLLLRVDSIEFEVAPGEFEVEIPNPGTTRIEVVVEDASGAQTGQEVIISSAREAHAVSRRR